MAKHRNWEEYIRKKNEGALNPTSHFRRKGRRFRSGRDLEGEQPCELPDRQVCRYPQNHPDYIECPNCFNQGWDEDCYLEGKPCGNRAAYSFVIEKFIGSYDRRRNKTILHEISGFGVTYAATLPKTDPRCRDCEYPNFQHRYKLTNKAEQTATGVIAVGTNYECSPDSTDCQGGRWTILPTPIGGGLFEIDGPGCLVPNDTCNNQWDFKLELSFNWSDGGNSEFGCPSGNAIPEIGQKHACDVEYYPGQDTPGSPNTGLAALDLSRSYAWGPVTNEPPERFNIALRQDTCDDEGCGTNYGSRPIFGGSPDNRPNLKFGFNTYSGYPACPC